MIRIGITTGDPAGIGPEILLEALSDPTLRQDMEPVVFGDERWLARLADGLGRRVSFEVQPAGAPWPQDLPRGMLGPEGARATLASLEAAVDAVRAGRVDALVTGPIHKGALRLAGFGSPGQTEWLAGRLGAGRVVMMLVCPRLRVVLATTHLPLRAVPGALDRDGLIATVRLAANELGRYFVPQGPRLAVCALNPHGEEGGAPGLEERTVIAPAVGALQADGLDVTGPVSADTVFARAAAGRYDAVVAMYHDQGLAPLKALCFSEAVNVTLGLGVVRTSPGHGVAYDIAGTGCADPASMRAAITTAACMLEREAGA